MEKPEKKLLLRHFSHEHLLEHTRESLPKGCHSVCFGCKHDILPGKQYYRCKICPFYLHQVCYNLQQKVQHQVDPNHNLILLSMPSSNIVDSSIQCKACQRHINHGFYYNCGRCGTFFHSLCLAIPLSVKLPANVHPHILTLEFSPPYNFQCDLCNEPSYNQGWLYHCGLCEFDAHISCAFMDKQIIDHTDDHNDNELMELLSRGMKVREEIENRSNASFQNQKQSQIDHDDQEIIPSSLSEDKTPLASYQCTPSYQFSDAYFSIDLAKSFLNDHHQEKRSSPEADTKQFQILGSNKEPEPIGFVIVPKSKGLVGDVAQVNPTLDVSRTPSFDSHSSLVIPNIVGSNAMEEIGRGNSRNTLSLASSNEEAADASKLGKKSKSGTVRSRCSCW